MYKIFTLLLTAAVVSACSEPPQPQTAQDVIRPAKIVVARAAQENAQRVFPGIVESALQSDLAFRVGGQIEQLPALPGKAFAEGDLLARLDDAEFQNTLADRQAKHALAKSQYEKVVRLQAKNYVSPAQVEEAEANLKAAQSALAVAEDNLKHTQLLAPFNGVVASLKVENHQVINPHETILRLRANNQLDVRFSVPESLLAKLKQVENPEAFCAEVRFNGFSEKVYSACFREFESEPDRLTRTYSAVYRLSTITDFSALPGMAVEVTVDLSHLLRDGQTQGVLIPLSAVFEQSGKTYVWRVADTGQVIKREVEVSGIIENQLLIISGLQANEAVVAAGLTYIHEGMFVRPMAKERGL